MTSHGKSNRLSDCVVSAKHFEKGILNDANKSHGVIIKTFVTTDLQKAIAEKSGIRCVETLTGFNRGERAEMQRAKTCQLQITTRFVRRRHAAAVAAFPFMCSEVRKATAIAVQTVRDKDGNSAVVMIAEVAAYAKSQGTTLVGLLDRIFSEFGFYLERESPDDGRRKKVRPRSRNSSIRP